MTDEGVVGGGATTTSYKSTDYPHLNGCGSTCPPAEAISEEKVFYATHEHDPPGGDDFATAFARKQFVRDDECRRRSHSVLLDEEDAAYLCEQGGRRHCHISRGTVKTVHGCHQATPTNRYTSHHSLWLRGGVDVTTIFTDVVKKDVAK